MEIISSSDNSTQSSQDSMMSLSRLEEMAQYYTNAFSDGFLIQNKTNMITEKWLGVNIKVSADTKSLGSNNDIIYEDYGVIEYFCRIKAEVALKDLFPITSKCDTSNTTIVPANCDLYITVASMRCVDMAKVTQKIQFYEELFGTKNSTLYYDKQIIDVSNPNKIVLFVYNGADSVNIKKQFKSSHFNYVVIHLPFEFCMTWQVNYSLEVRENEIQVREREIQVRCHEIHVVNMV